MEKEFFEIKDEEINVEEIMKEIRQNIKKRKVKEEKLPDLKEILLEYINTSAEFDINNLYETNTNINNQWATAGEVTITSHRKILGRIIVFLKKLTRKCLRWYINPINEKQQNFNCEVTRNLNEVREFIRLSQYINDKIELNSSLIKESIDKLEVKINKLDTKMISINEENTELKIKIENYKDQLEKNINLKNSEESELIDIKKNHNDIYLRLKLCEENVRNLNTQFSNCIDSNVYSNERLRRIERNFKQFSIINKSNENISIECNNDADIDYFMFENIFRGSREDIKDRQKIYLEYLKHSYSIVDIGCGRGELLEILKENGKSKAIGVEINEDMVNYCIEKGLDVRNVDAFEYLRQLHDKSLDAIILNQVIEHLAPKQVSTIIKLAYEKLTDKGIVIIETVNPKCLSVYTNAYSLDPSHKMPLHPYTGKYILESEGFSTVETIYMSKCNSEIPKLVGEGIENIREFNSSIEKVNELLFGYQDYALIAKK